MVRQSGHAVLTVDKYKESYLFPFPGTTPQPTRIGRRTLKLMCAIDVYAKNVLTGSPYPELYGTYQLLSTSGYTAEITFGGKSKNPFSSSSRNEFEARLYKTKDANKEAKFTLKGIWSDSWTIKDCSGKTISDYTLSDEANQPAPMKMAPLDKQSPWESRRAWQDVARPLEKAEYSKALDAKSKLENAQREMRKKEKTAGKTWESAFFRKPDEQQESALMALLAELKAGGIETRDILGNNGCWRFDAEKEKRWKAGETPWPETPYG